MKDKQAIFVVIGFFFFLFQSFSVLAQDAQIIVSDATFQENSKAFRLLKQQLSTEPSSSIWVINGNLFPSCKLNSPTASELKNIKSQMKRLVELKKDFAGSLFILPGPNEWRNGHQDGYENIEVLESLLNQYVPSALLLPSSACPGPEELVYGNHTLLVFLDTQWWLHQEKKTNSSMDCPYISSNNAGVSEVENNIIMALHDIIARNPERNILIFAHHPLASNGLHGGSFPASALLFPLRLLHPALWIPLPGFLYTGYRSYIGEPQDLSHPEYKEFRQRFIQLLSGHTNVVYIAGHDQILEMDPDLGVQHIQCGSLGNHPLEKKEQINEKGFLSGDPGFAVFHISGSGAVDVKFTQENQHRDTSFLLCPAPGNLVKNDVAESFVCDKKYINAGDGYEAGGWHRFWLGNNYRAAWAAQDSFPCFHIGEEKGGLIILQRGGGFQTSSYRLQNPEGKQYVLRSVDKSVSKVMSEEFSNTVAEDVVQDMISASFPYGALIVPTLANAVGVYHTNPQYVYMPDDPALGIYRNEMKDRLFLYEERPAGNRKDVCSFGRPKDMKSTFKILKKLEEEQTHKVDQEQVLRSRMLDIYIGDWDRHDDQWRWSVFENSDGETIYKPVPRDRDNAFFKGEGPLLWLASRKWMLPKFQGFDSTSHDVVGLEYNARHFDRTFLNEADKKTWEKLEKDFLSALSDSVIELAVKKALPQSVYDINGESLINKLKSRRTYLPEYFDQYYQFLSQNIDVPGTDRRELFLLDRISDDSTRLEIFAISDKKGRIKRKMYARTFDNRLTKSINLYGLDGDDKFVLSGSVNKSPLVRIIGGKGKKDVVIDSSHVSGWSHKSHVFDKKGKIKIAGSGETRNRTANYKGINKYDRLLFEYNKLMPLVGGGYNADDGFFIGAGAMLNRYNWRDSTRQTILARIAFASGAYNLSYSGRFSNVVGRLDLDMDAHISIPEYVNNFYGFGNESLNNHPDKDYYRVRYHLTSFRPLLRFNAPQYFHASFGPLWMSVKVEDSDGRIMDKDKLPADWDKWFQTNYYGGLGLKLEYDNRNNIVVPSRGLRAVFAMDNFRNFTAGESFSRMSFDLRYYLSFHRNPGAVLAFRLGGIKMLGDYPFYYAAALGGATNLRGFRANRFTGDEAIYQNTELRIRLFHVKNYLMNGDIGILGFYDCGRIWYDGQKSDLWHHGYGGGIWGSPYGFLAINVLYEQSKEERIFSLKFSYQF